MQFELEIKTYTQLPYLDDEADPVEYWRENDTEIHASSSAICNSREIVQPGGTSFLYRSLKTH